VSRPSAGQQFEFLRTAQVKLQLTRKQFATRLGVSVSCLNKWMTTEGTADYRKIPETARILINELLGSGLERDLATLVHRLAVRFPEDDPARIKALDFLKRHDLTGTVFRKAKPEPEIKDEMRGHEMALELKFDPELQKQFANVKLAKPIVLDATGSPQILVTLTGLSGSGKTTLEKFLTDGSVYKMGRIVSSTTRSPRPREKQEGPDRAYDFVDWSFFDRNTFVEYTNFNGNLYGVSEDELRSKLNEFTYVVCVCEPVGVRQLHSYCQDNGIVHLPVMVVADVRECMKRLIKRSGDSTDEITALARRLGHIPNEVKDTETLYNEIQMSTAWNTEHNSIQTCAASIVRTCQVIGETFSKSRQSPDVER
jgi:guanylate kinase/transcriptional regulator with XRE-family HTH domain